MALRINAVRGHGINPRLLGMVDTVSEDTVRQGIGRIGEKAGLDWLRGHLLASIAPALGLPWILDIDSTEGLQSGMEADAPDAATPALAEGKRPPGESADAFRGRSESHAAQKEAAEDEPPVGGAERRKNGASAKAERLSAAASAEAQDP